MIILIFHAEVGFCRDKLPIKGIVRKETKRLMDLGWKAYPGSPRLKTQLERSITREIEWIDDKSCDYIFVRTVGESRKLNNADSIAIDAIYVKLKSMLASDMYGILSRATTHGDIHGKGDEGITQSLFSVKTRFSVDIDKLEIISKIYRKSRRRYTVVMTAIYKMSHL